MTRKQAVKEFKTTILGGKHWPDRLLVWSMWNDFVMELHRIGEITEAESKQWMLIPLNYENESQQSLRGKS